MGKICFVWKWSCCTVQYDLGKIPVRYLPLYRDSTLQKDNEQDFGTAMLILALCLPLVIYPKRKSQSGTESEVKSEIYKNPKSNPKQHHSRATADLRWSFDNSFRVLSESSIMPSPIGLACFSSRERILRICTGVLGGLPEFESRNSYQSSALSTAAQPRFVHYSRRNDTLFYEICYAVGYLLLRLSPAVCSAASRSGDRWRGSPLQAFFHFLKPNMRKYNNQLVPTLFFFHAILRYPFQLLYHSSLLYSPISKRKVSQHPKIFVSHYTTPTC
jgi:hypothetical protein